MRLLLLCAALAACSAPVAGEQQEDELTATDITGCGVERQSIKIGSDAEASQVSLAPVATTIAQLRAIPGVAYPPLHNRVAPTELTTWKLSDVTLVQYKSENDSDIHLVLSSGGLTMIAEIPWPGCVAGQGSPFEPGVAQARPDFAARYTATPVFATADVPVTVTGVGFFDFAHGQTGAAPNQIELHPVLSICFGLGCTPTPIPDGGAVDAGGAADGGQDAGPPDSGSLPAADGGTTNVHGPTRGCNSTGAAALPMALLAALYARRISTSRPRPR